MSIINEIFNRGRLPASESPPHESDISRNYEIERNEVSGLEKTNFNWKQNRDSDPLTLSFQLLFNFESLLSPLLNGSLENWFNEIGMPLQVEIVREFKRRLRKIQEDGWWWIAIDNFKEYNNFGVDVKEENEFFNFLLSIETHETYKMEIQTLKQLYRQIVWDNIANRWNCPENLREFQCSLYIGEGKNIQTWNERTSQFENWNEWKPFKKINLYDCQFINSEDYNGAPISNIEGEPVKNKIEIGISSFDIDFKIDKEMFLSDAEFYLKNKRPDASVGDVSLNENFQKDLQTRSFDSVKQAERWNNEPVETENVSFLKRFLSNLTDSLKRRGINTLKTIEGSLERDIAEIKALADSRARRFIQEAQRSVDARFESLNPFNASDESEIIQRLQGVKDWQQPEIKQWAETRERANDAENLTFMHSIESIREYYSELLKR